MQAVTGYLGITTPQHQAVNQVVGKDVGKTMPEKVRLVVFPKDV